MNVIRVLVVDDNATARQTLRAHLERPGFSTTEASTGLEALELLETREFDVILLDVMMPGLTGFETCQRIKANPEWQATPIIMATALDSSRDRIEGLQSGADDFLSKPINGTELRLRITAHSKVKAYHSLLENVLPSSIARRLRDEPGFVADRIPNATILFSDLVGFVPFARNRPANEVVGILDDIFRGFDQRCAQECLEKIKTIGDAYMLAGGLHSQEDPVDAASRVVQAGLDFFKILEQVNEYHNLELKLRIGISSGPLIAGVIGESRLAYDLWGDTVNLASRMESHGIAGSIQISPETYKLVEEQFDFESRGTQRIKGHPPMETWLIRGLV